MKSKLTLSFLLTLTAAATLACVAGCSTRRGGPLSPQSAARIDADATAALQNLYAVNPAAKALGANARAILIFPDVVKGGFMIGGQLGNGVLRQDGRTTVTTTSPRPPTDFRPACRRLVTRSFS
jgi:lipid-binding SYLF domain-containing protein